MQKSVFGFMTVFGAALLVGGQAQAQQTGSIGASTSPPIGFVQFCRDNPNDCENRTMSRTAIPLNESSWRMIVKVNADVTPNGVPWPPPATRPA